MQIGAHSLLIAAQQARAPQPAKPPAQKAEFEPLPLKQTAAARQTTPAQPAGPVARPGSQLDISV
jgi:hypothetical protein